MFSARRGQDFRRDRYEPLVTVAHAPSSLPISINTVQGPQPADPQHRRATFQWMVQQDLTDPNFLSRVPVTDEAYFTRNFILNSHNMFDENLHSVQETRFQHQFTINIWAEVIGDLVMGPYQLLARLRGLPIYIFNEELPQLLEDVPLEMRQTMRFMLDGFSAHFTSDGKQFFDSH
jgi:hypothetical protein